MTKSFFPIPIMHPYWSRSPTTIDTSTDAPTFWSDMIPEFGKSVLSTGFVALMEEDILISEKFGLPLKKQVKCPACGIDGILIQVISHLNNKTGQTHNVFDIEHGTHDWSFKQIGHWLKELGY